jgi:Tol biopolymer transport system component
MSPTHSLTAVPGTLRTLQWIDRKGQRQPVAIEPGPYVYPRLSPDGHRVSLEMTRAGNRDIWILDLDRVSFTRLTDGPK